MCYVYVHYVTKTLCQTGSSKAVAEQKITKRSEVFQGPRRTQIVKVRERLHAEKE